MPRKRTLDPSNLPIRPNLATDPNRIAELVGEFRKRLEFLTRSYGLAQFFESNYGNLNDSLSRLKDRVSGKTKNEDRGERLHMFVELAINLEARKIATERGSELNQDIIERAATRVAKDSNLLRGRPKIDTLRHHVAGLMALTHQYLGSPVMVRKYNEIYKYEPHAVGATDKAMLVIVQMWDESVTETQLVNLILKIRREYAGKPLRFLDLFPNYGSSIDCDGQPKFRAPYKLVKFEANVPIYCP